MPKYDDDMMEEEMRKAPRKFEIPDRLKSDRIPNLPSDTALESNKARQDEEAMSFAKRIAKGILGGPAGIGADLAADAMKRVPKVPKFKGGGKVSSASKRADGIAQRGKTRGKII